MEDFIDPREPQRDIYKRHVEELERQLHYAATRNQRGWIRCKMLFLMWSHRIGWSGAQWTAAKRPEG